MELDRELEDTVPNGTLFDLLVSTDPSRLSDAETLTAVVMTRKAQAMLEHVAMRLLSAFPNTTEVALATHQTEQSVMRQKELGDALVALPRLAEQVQRGELDMFRLTTVYKRVEKLPSQAMVEQVEDELLDVAAGLNNTTLAHRTNRLVGIVDPNGFEARHTKAKAERKVEFIPLPDGMTQVRATLSAADARGLYNTLINDARTMPRDDDRTTDQRRADALVDRVQGKASRRASTVHVTISMETLLGLTQDPGLLAGYGPIPAATACELAALGDWRLILLDKYRHATAISSRRHTPPAALRELLTAHGHTCTAPGCNNPIQELDHVIPWPQGPTTNTNLQGLCAWHHHVKHRNYHVTKDPDGTTRWITPQGRHYTSHPHEY